MARTAVQVNVDSHSARQDTFTALDAITKIDATAQQKLADATETKNSAIGELNAAMEMAKQAASKGEEIQSSMTTITELERKAEQMAVEASHEVQKTVDLKGQAASNVLEIAQLLANAKVKSEEAISAQVAARSAAEHSSSMARKAAQLASEAESSRKLVVTTLDQVTQIRSEVQSKSLTASSFKTEASNAFAASQQMSQAASSKAQEATITRTESVVASHQASQMASEAYTFAKTAKGAHTDSWHASFQTGQLATQSEQWSAAATSSHMAAEQARQQSTVALAATTS